jgi:hypothetical protein
MSSNEGIRRDSPGKFSTILDSYVYAVSMDGVCDDEIGSVDENGAWYGLMRRGRTLFKDPDPFLETLNEAEQAQLTDCAGVILSENTQGFVDVAYYDTGEELDKAWSAIVDDLRADEANRS